MVLTTRRQAGAGAQPGEVLGGEPGAGWQVGDGGDGAADFGLHGLLFAGLRGFLPLAEQGGDLARGLDESVQVVGVGGELVIAEV